MRAEPLLDLFGAPVPYEERKVRRSRRRQAQRFWDESKARGRPPPESILEMCLHEALEAGDREMVVRICIAFLPYRLPRLAAVMVAQPGAERLRLAWGDEHDDDDPTAGAIGASAVLAALVPASDTPER